MEVGKFSDTKLRLSREHSFLLAINDFLWDYFKYYLILDTLEHLNGYACLYTCFLKKGLILFAVAATLDLTSMLVPLVYTVRWLFPQLWMILNLTSITVMFRLLTVIILADGRLRKLQQTYAHLEEFLTHRIKRVNKHNRRQVFILLKT